MPVSLPATLAHPCRRHHHHHPLRHHRHHFPATIVAVAIALAAVAIPSSSPTTIIITVAIALATLTLASSPPSLVTTITHVVNVAVTIALVAVNLLPSSLPLLLLPKRSLSSLHPNLVANAIARFIPLALFVTRHPYPHHHRLSAFTLFVTACSHC
jgi:hypothetical protein